MILKVENLAKSFEIGKKSLTVFEDFNLEIEMGEYICMIGPSGCGKSTILRVISGLLEMSKGKVLLEKEVKIGFVFQDYALFPYLTVLENIEFGLKMTGETKEKRQKVARELILEVGLNGFEEKHPKELSGGMRQRVGIARALAIEPAILLMDEPFSSLDEFTAEDLRKLIIKIWNKRKITVLMVTHLVSEAIELSDRIVVLAGKPGKIRQIVENKLARPRDLRQQTFFEMEDKLKALMKN